MTNSGIPAYIQEANRKGEDFVPVLIVRFNPETQTHSSVEKKIRTRQAMVIFSKPMSARKQNEKLVRPIDFTTGAAPAKLDARKALALLSDDDLMKAMEERGLAAKAKGRKKATEEEKPFAPDTSINEIFPGEPTVTAETE